MSKKKSNKQNRQNATIKESPKYKTYLYYFFFFLLGTLVNVSEYLEKISKIPSSYQEFKKTYIYDESFLSGNWSNNTEYILNAEDLKIKGDQPLIAMILTTDTHGGIEGDILMKKLCDADPITWLITINSEDPSFFNLFMDRVFYIKRLHLGHMETLAELKLVEEDKKNNTIKFKKITDITGTIPDYIHLAKNPPKFEDNWEELQNSCVESTKKFHQKLLETKNNAVPQK